MTRLETITRQELAYMLGMSAKKIQMSEARIGLKACRCRWSKRTVIYRKKDAFNILRSMGFPL